MLERGLLDAIPAEQAVIEDTKLRYLRNPLENVSQVIFEYTSKCTFHCHHCYNSTVPRTTETDTSVLKRTADALADMGVRHFSFIGGEVIQFGDDWLNLVNHIKSISGKYAQPFVISVLTSGWFLEKNDFKAAGKTYPDASALFFDLKEAGVTHVGFSLDGQNATIHDTNRRVFLFLENNHNKRATWTF